MKFSKNDLLNDARFAAFNTNVGDIVSLIAPGESVARDFTVVAVNKTPGVFHPDSGEHLTSVSVVFEG